MFSRILDWNDRGTCVLFGDGAGAVVLRASEAPGIHASVLRADGRHAGILSVPGNVSGGKIIGSPSCRWPATRCSSSRSRSWTKSARETLAAAGAGIGDVDWLIPHQANVRILDATARKLGLPPEKLVVTVGHHGNTSAASIPLALDEYVRAGKILPGHRLLMEGVGGGFTWGAVYATF